MAVHIQVPFVCVDGEVTEVDAGMFDILTELKLHGVKTLYSCQGAHGRKMEDDRSYVLIRARTMWALLWRIAKTYRADLYSQDSRRLVQSFLLGYHELYFGLYKDQGTYRLLNAKFSHNPPWVHNHTELSVSSHDGLRFCFRWRASDNDLVLKLLRET